MTYKKIKLIGKIKNAFNGIGIGIREESNLRFHFGVFVLVVAVSLLLKIEALEFAIVLVMVALVISVELLNTTIENICDLVTLDEHQGIKKIKDISAGAVLFASLVAMVVGFIIFIPKIYTLFLLA